MFGQLGELRQSSIRESTCGVVVFYLLVPRPKVEKATAAKDEADRRARREKQDLTARLRAAEAALRASEAENERLQARLGRGTLRNSIRGAISSYG